jgi:hypothetical protein
MDHRFRWLPGRGPDVAAIGRLRSAFPKPKTPMGESWFMGGNRRMFESFAAESIACIPIREFDSFLFNLSSGTSSFGARAEWTEWFGYVLPDLIERSHERFAYRTLLEPTVSAFLSIFGSMTFEGQRSFQEDIALTLGRALMKSELWFDARRPRLGLVLGVPGTCDEATFWSKTSSDFAAGIFIALRVFPLSELPAFLDSVLEIEDPAWRARVATWILGIVPFLRCTTTTRVGLLACTPPVDWDHAHAIAVPEGGTLLSRERCEVTVAHLRKRFASTFADGAFDGSPAIAYVMRTTDVVGALRARLF